MLYKSKINLSLILLIIGIGLIPSGLFFKAYITDNVYSQVPQFLSDLEDQVNDEIELNYLGLGLARVLPAIYNTHITDIEEDAALVYGIPATLRYLKNVTLELLPRYINASRAALAIVNTLTSVINLNSTTGAIARAMLFNNYTFQDDYYTTIEGVSEFTMGGTESLNYTGPSINYLLYGRTVGDTDYPGILNNPIYGTEMLDWLEFYYNAKNDIGTNRSLIQTVYECSWVSGKLQNLSVYITSYLWEVLIKSDYAPLDLEEYAELVFYDQWANASWILSGYDLTYFSEYITSSITGLEVGRNNPTGINYTSAVNLWDPLNTSSFINDKGILKWFAALGGNVSAENELKNDFMLNDASTSSIYSWLFTRVRFYLVDLIYILPAPIGIGMSILEYSDILYAEQWAYGSHIKDGFNLQADVKPFEIGLPTATSIPLGSAMALLDPSNTSSFIDRDGIVQWIDAYEGDSTAQNNLITTFNLDLAQLNTINDWLFSTLRYNITPSITWRYTRTRMFTFAQWEYYRQWANGSDYRDGLEIGPFHGLTSIAGWEIGLPTATSIDRYTAYILWRDTNQYSFLHWKGMSYWYTAMKNGSAYDFLLNYYNTPNLIRIGLNYYNASLSYDQMDALLAWIANIRDNYVLNSIQIQSNLPTDSYTLGNNIFLMFTIAGGVISGIGVLGVVVLLITKRK